MVSSEMLILENGDGNPAGVKSVRWAGPGSGILRKKGENMAKNFGCLNRQGHAKVTLLWWSCCVFFG